jgi:hypothetical protein
VTKTRTFDAVPVLAVLAGLLAAAAVWAGSSLAGGSGADGGGVSPGATIVQVGEDDRDCPDRGGSADADDAAASV